MSRSKFDSSEIQRSLAKCVYYDSIQHPEDVSLDFKYDEGQFKLRKLIIIVLGLEWYNTLTRRYCMQDSRRYTVIMICKQDVKIITSVTSKCFCSFNLYAIVAACHQKNIIFFSKLV